MTVNGRMTVTTAVACVLASTALLPLFSNSLWFAIAAGAVIAVAATGALTRLRTLPVPVCLAASAAGLVLYLNLIFEARHSLLFVIPTPGSLSRLWDLAGTGMHDASRYAPQVPNLPGLLLLAAGGVGITAVLADLIAVRLRSTALAGLPLLVLFTVPVMMNASHNQFIASAGVLPGRGGIPGHAQHRRPGTDPGLGPTGLVLALITAVWPGLRHGRAFRHAAPGPRAATDTRALAAAGRRVGLASIVLALCVPLLLPGLHPSKLFSSGPGIGGNGGGAGAPFLSLPSALAQTVTELHESRPTTVFTYTTGASPARADQRRGVLQAVRVRHAGRRGLAGKRLYGEHRAAQFDLRTSGPDRHHVGLRP